MQTQIFDQTTAITSTAAEVFNSETYQGGILAVADAVYGGFAITNTGSATAQLQIDIKVHPNGSWLSQSAMGVSFNTALAPNLTNIFFRHTNSNTTTINTGAIPSGTTIFFSITAKFIYGIRILSRMGSGSSGNSVRVRGNFKIPGNTNYEEVAKQTIPTAIINSSSQPFWVDVSEHNFFNNYIVASGTGIPQSVAASTLPGVNGIASGYFLGIRFYPADTAVFWVSIGTGSSSLENQVRFFVIQRTEFTSSFRTATYRVLVEAAYEMGWLFSMTGGQTLDQYISLNG
jgi:hypothetical protein